MGGEFKEDRRQGVCYNVMQNTSYGMFGQFYDDDFNGMVFSINSLNGNQYTYHGKFQNGKPHGFGVLQNEDGSKYEGTFKEGLKDGIGLQREAKDGEERMGKWLDGAHVEWI